MKPAPNSTTPTITAKNDAKAHDYGRPSSIAYLRTAPCPIEGRHTNDPVVVTASTAAS